MSGDLSMIESIDPKDLERAYWEAHKVQPDASRGQFWTIMANRLNIERCKRCNSSDSAIPSQPSAGERTK